MATLLHTESRRKYSWWWDSHISPKNSKWLQENLTDMDTKVKSMIKLIEEDADSFARRAEMYYKKRPELMKLVEEFYRAYRALAERYDHATGALRQAHRTMAEAFPNQVPFILADDSPSVSSTTETEPRTPEMPHPIRAFCDPDDLHKEALGLSSSHFQAFKRNGAYSEESEDVTIQKGLKELNDMFGSDEVVPHHPKFAEGSSEKGLNFHEEVEQESSLRDTVSQFSTENQNLKTIKTKVMSESERAGKAETEVQKLKAALAELEAEKETALFQYQQSLERLSNLETEVSCAEEDARGLNERASKAETEVQTLKQDLFKLQAEKEAGLLQYQQSMEKISSLEAKIFCAEEDAIKLDERATKAEIEAQNLKEALTRIEAEKEAGLLEYKECLETISNLEVKLSCAEEDANKLNERAYKAETEVQTLKQMFAKLDAEKEAAALQYQQCLEKISNLEIEISHGQEEARRLNSEIVMGVAKLNGAEEQCLLLERANQSLQSEVEALVQKMGMQTQEITEKHEELERLQVCIQEEHLHFLQAEAALKTLQNLHSQSQEELRTLVLELQNAIQMWKDMELQNQRLMDEVQQVKEENKSLNEQNLSSAMSIKNQQEEIFGLRETKGKLEVDVELRLDQRNALQQEIYCLKEEINDLNRRHQGIMEQVELVGLNPKCFGSSVKDLQDENLKLKEICQKNKDERVALLEKLENMEKLLEKNALLENSLSDANAELDGFREKVKVLEESCQSLQEEKSTLVAEKASLVSQFEVMAENVEKLSEKNTLLENSLCDTNVELEGLKTKSNSLEESCQFIDNEKSALLAEKDTLVSQLESIQQRLEDLEKRYTDLEEKYSAMQKEKETTAYQVKELGVSLDLEKQARASFTQSSEARLAALEKQIYVLQEEGQWRKREYEEELDRAMNNQVEIFILKRFIQDMEEKNFSLLIECQKHSEVSKLSKKLISELEQENLKLQVETKSLFDQIKKLGTGINQVLRSLEIDPDLGCHDDIKEDQLLLKNIIGKIENTKFSFLKIQDEKLQLLFENSVLVTLLGQLRLEAANLESERNTLDKEFKIRMEELIMLQNEKHKLLEINGQLELEVTAGGHREEILKAEMEKLQAKLSDLQLAYLASQDENSNLLKENGSLRKELSDLTEKTCMLEEESSVILGEAMALGNLSVIFESFGTEKTGELKGLSEHLDCLLGVNSDLQNEARIMESKLGMVEMDNLQLKESVQNLENELSGVKNESNQLIHQVSTGKDLLCQKEMELSASEKRLIITESDNKALCNDIEELKREYNEAEAIRGELEKKIIKLSADNTCQAWEIGCLCEANDKFELEQGKLQDEIKELKSTEEKLSYELQEKINDIKLLEDEAATFYGDLQMSNVREALLKEKLHELIGACEGLEGESASKTVEIEQMNERFGVLEGENGRLKAELATYFPAIVSLRENITSLEDRALLQTKVLIDDNQEPRDAELAGHKDQPEGVSDLLELQTRVKAIERAVMEMEKLAASENLDTKVKLEAAMKEIQELKSRGRSFKEFQTSRDMDVQPEMVRELGDNLSDDLKLHKNEPEMSEVGNGLQMKDIPLDQVTTDCSSYEHGHGVGPYGMGKKGNGKTGDEILELWETAEQDCSLDLKGNKGQKLASAPTEGGIEYHQIVAMGEQKGEYPSSGLQVEKELGVDKLEVSRTFSEPRQEGNKRKTLERLASDAQKLMNLQVTVEELKKKLVEVSGKRKNAKGIEYDSVKGQLQQVEEAIMQLVDINDALTKNTDESPLSSDGKTLVELEESKSVRRRVSQQAQQGSEKIGRLQLDLQKIQFILLKLDENESKGKTTVAEGRTRVLLRDYLYGIGKSHDRRKNTSFCGCVRPSTEED